MAEEFQIGDFDYHLPEELIAQEPCINRTDARLLVVYRSGGTLAHHRIRDLPQLLNNDDLLIFNNSRVLPARLYGVRSKTGGKWEGLYLRERADLDRFPWELLSHTRGYLQPGEWIDLIDLQQRFSGYRLQVTGRTPEKHLLVRVNPDIQPEELCDTIGHIPLPHYIRHGVDTPADRVRYQTVFAEHSGSIAAPTAGLHFTTGLLEQLRNKGIRQTHVTLHVGVGTFTPIKAKMISEHVMHDEWCTVPQKAVDAINACTGRKIAIGTTSVRALESAFLQQDDHQLHSWTGSTNLFIQPGFSFHVIDALMTNFHLPKSTLLILISAFAGHELIKHAYQEAIRERYRFFSYGDAMLIL